MTTVLVIVIALALELFLFPRLSGALYTQANGLPLWVGLAVLSLPRVIVYGLTTYLGVRFLDRYGDGIAAWVFVVVVVACWFALRWGYDIPGPGWIGILFTYTRLLAAPIGLIVGAVIARRTANPGTVPRR